LSIPHESTDEGLSGPKHVVSGIIKTSVCVIVTPPFLFKNVMPMILEVNNIADDIKRRERYTRIYK
jgi:hypothetical protein